MCLLSFRLIYSKVITSIPLNVSVFKRNYPGGKEFGHAAKLLNSASKMLKDNIIPALVKPRPNILVYDRSKVENQMQTNYVFQKYQEIYEEKGLIIPFIKENFIKGVPGSFTLPPIDRNGLINKQEPFMNQHAYIVARYAITMYGGEPITNHKDIVHRTNQLFTYDPDAIKFSGPENHVHGVRYLFPALQHWLALDTHSLLLDKRVLSDMKNINFTLKQISIFANSELNVLARSHRFLIEENKDELLVLDPYNKEHQLLLSKWGPFIERISGQPEPDIIGNRIMGLNQRVYYPLDAKRVWYPELNLNALSSHGSESPDFQCAVALDKLYGQLQHKIQKLSEKSFFNWYITKLKLLREDHQKGLTSRSDFEAQYRAICIHLFQSQVKLGRILHEGESFLPSFIAETQYPKNNSYTIMQENNPEKLKELRVHAANHFDFNHMYPTYQQLKNFQGYDFELSLMDFLKKNDMIENYYALRRIADISELTC